MSKADEMVLVIHRHLFDALGDFQGINLEVDRYLPQFLSRENNFFLRRGVAEIDPKYKQLIPYAVFTFQGKILHYVRGNGSGEQRLVALGSIGIGGHINDTDESLFSFNADAYEAAVRREISEELGLTTGFEERIVGLINDDSNEVGQVHLGVVHHVQLTSPEVRSRESALRQLEFLSIEALKERLGSLETWSQYVVTHWDQLSGINK